MTTTPPHNWKPATQFTNNQHTGTHENQFDLFPEKASSQSNEGTRDTPKTGKHSGRLNTGDKGGVEVVKATKYEDIKTEIESGQLEPTVDAIARRIYNDESVNLIIPKCKKVAESVVKKWEEENQNTRPSEGDSLEENRPVRSGTSGGNSEPVRSGSLGLIDKVSFDLIYGHIVAKVRANEISPSLKSVKVNVNNFVKENSQMEAINISLIESQNIAKSVITRMQSGGVIIDNPNYKNGLPKYLVA